MRTWIPSSPHVLFLGPTTPNPADGAFLREQPLPLQKDFGKSWAVSLAREPTISHYGYWRRRGNPKGCKAATVDVRYLREHFGANMCVLPSTGASGH